MRSGRAATRGALQQATGLSRATVGQRLDRLFRAGWLREGAGGPVDSPLGGRPSITLEFDDAHAVVLAADLDTRHARAAVLSLTGEILAEHSGALVIEDGPDAVLGELGRWFAELLEKAGHRADGGLRHRARGARPGRHRDRPGRPAADHARLGRLRHKGPAGQGVRRAHGRRSGVSRCSSTTTPTSWRTANSAPRHPDCSAFVLVKVSTGIGAGVVVDGSVYRGIDGGAGDLGHIRVPAGADALCRCGSYGCLAAVASGGAVARRLAEAGVPAASGSDVRDLLASGHPEAAALARDAGGRSGTSWRPS